jgi:hypothetical protein
MQSHHTHTHTHTHTLVLVWSFPHHTHTSLLVGSFSWEQLQLHLAAFISSKLATASSICCRGSISLPALVLGMSYTYTQYMYIKHQGGREPHTHTHTSLDTHTHTIHISLYQLASCENTAFQEWSMQLIVWRKGFACPCAYLACMNSFWAMCMCVAPAVQQLPHYMHTPAGKQLHDFVNMYSSCPTASTIHVHTCTPQLSNSFHITCASQLATSSMLVSACTPAVQQLPCYTYISQLANSSMCVCMLKMHVCENLCVYVCACLTMPSTHAPKHKMHVSTYLQPSDFVKKSWRTYRRNAPKVVTDNGLIIFNNF